MKADQKIKQSPKKGIKRSPETIEERVHRHISDINSKITDDDIKSVRTELDIRRNSAEPQGENKPNKKQKKSSGRKKKTNEETGPEKKTTPWDLLSEGYD